MPNLLTITNNNNTIPVVTMSPQWSEPIQTTFSTQTTTFETLSGREHRTARLYRPLVSVDYVGIALNLAEHLLYKNIFANWQNGIYAVPVWMDAVAVTSPITSGATYFNANGFNRTFEWFRYAMLWVSPEHCQVIEISNASIGYNGGKKQIVCKNGGGVTQNFPAGTYLVPLAIGSISQPDREFITNAINTIQISFTEKQGAITFRDGDTLAAYISGTPKQLTTIKENVRPGEAYGVPDKVMDYDHFILMPNWDLAENIYSEQDDVYYDAIDGGAAKPWIINENGKYKISLGYTLSRYDLQYLLKFFEEKDGSNEEFWVPTWTADHDVTGTSALNNVFVVYKDMSIEFCASVVPTSKTNVNFICNAVKCRFAEDDLEVSAVTNNLYNVTCNFVQCECAVIDGDSETEDTTEKIVYLYELQKQGSGTVSYFANYGYSLSYDSHTYTAADISFSEVIHDVDALDNKIDVSCSGLDDYLALNMRVTIKKCSVNADDSITDDVEIFKGICTKLATENNGVKSMTVESYLYPFDNEVPRVKLQRQCNWDFGGESCGIQNEKDILYRNIQNIEGQNHYYIYVDGDAIDITKASDFFMGVNAKGVNYSFVSIAKEENENILQDYGTPFYKFPISYDNNTVTNDLAMNAAVNNGGWYNNKVLINDVWFDIIKRNVNDPPNGYTRLRPSKNGADLGPVINDPTSDYNGHQAKFLFQVFQQDPSYNGLVQGVPPLNFQVTYFKKDPAAQQNQDYYIMSCFFYAPSYAGRTDAKRPSENNILLYLPTSGSAVSLNNTTLHVKDYITDNTMNYVVFKESNVASLSGGSLVYDDTTLHWSASDPVPEYNVIRIELSADDYNTIFNTDPVTKIKLRRYCNKKISCCKECYNNVPRFGGFPWLPNNTPYEYTENTESGKK